MSSEFSPAFKVLTDYLDTNEYNYTPYPEENRINFNVSGHHADYRVQLRITHEGEYFQIALHYPFRIRDEKMRLSVSELVTRANYMMVLGKFEMDMSDGKIRFHVAQLIEGGPFTQETVERIYISSLFTMDRYFPAFMQHIHAGYTPEDAIYLAELDYHAESVVEEKKPSSKHKEEAKSSPAASDSSARPSIDATSSGKPLSPSQGSSLRSESSAPLPSGLDLDTGVSPSPKRTRKKGKNTPGQGELPL